MESTVNKMPQQEVARNYLALSREFQDSQLYRKAEDTLLVALDKLPHHPFVLARLASLYLKLDMQDKALETLNRLVKHHGNLSFPYFLRGRLHETLNDFPRAVQDYEWALQETSRDVYILHRLIPLLMKDGQVDKALHLIRAYQVKLDKPFLFAEHQAEALLQLGNNAAAFNKMRDALLNRPGSKHLLMRYLTLTNQSGKKKPEEVYQILQLSVPGLAPLHERDMTELQVQYLTQHENLSEALAKLEIVLQETPEDFHWRKKAAFLKLQMGLLEESVEEFRILFLQDSTDLEIRNVLENYFIVNGNLDNWKQLVQQVLQRHSNQIELFNYLRSIGKKKDWLAICELDYPAFMNELEQLNLACSDVQDVTFEKLPAYALEIFISQVAIHNQIPDPAALWTLIHSERQKKNQVPPFHPEDLEAAYTVWVFDLHLYFLFKSYSDFDLSFNPREFQNEQTLVTIDFEDKPVYVDISQLILGENRRLKQVVKSDHGLRWRWAPGEAEPEIMLHEIRFFTEAQFKTALETLQTAIAAYQSEAVA